MLNHGCGGRGWWGWRRAGYAFQKIHIFMDAKVYRLTRYVFIKAFIRTRMIAKCIERILNKTAKAINETFAGLKLMLQGLRKYFV